MNENALSGALVGNLSATDAETGDTHTFSLTDDPGGRFQISGSQLKVAAGAALDYEVATSHNVTVVATDQGGLASPPKTFAIAVNNLFDVAPTDVSLSGSSVDENSTAGRVVGDPSATDVETCDTHTLSLTDT